MKKVLALFLCFVSILTLLSGCGGGAADGEATAGGLKIAVLEGKISSDVWMQVCNAFEEQTGTKVNLVVCKTQEELTAAKADVIHSGTSADFIRQVIQDKKLHDLTGVLTAVIPGETQTVADKIAEGFLDSAVTMPYDDGKTYIAPMFYTPYGFFYNAKWFETMRWSAPATWDDMWQLAGKAAASGKYLFTYPKAEQMEAFLCALMYAVGGADFYNGVVRCDTGVWDSKEGKNFAKTLEKLAKYTYPQTAANANDTAYKENQLAVMRNDVQFMPNSTWVATEMQMEEQSFGPYKFHWGVTAFPALSPEDSSHICCTVEQMWIPADTEKKTEAEQFVAFMYSDKAAKLFAAKGAVQPIKGSSSLVDASSRMFYAPLDDGAVAALGNGTIPPVIITSFNQLVDGTINSAQFLANVKAAAQ